MDVLGNLRLGRDHIVGVWMAPLTHAVSIINDLICQPSVRGLANIGVYCYSLCVMKSLGNLS